ncbi:MAG: 50S ribosomal protein L23 [Oscillospiraceae bacterium]
MKTAPQDIVLGPIITENSMQGIPQRKYTFRVAKSATKIDIASAVESLFGVEVNKVNTISVRGQFRRQGAHGGYTASYKKAIVTLSEKSKGIEFFESMT